MKHFITLADLPNFEQTLDLAMDLKRIPHNLMVWAKAKPWACCFLTPV